MFAQIDQKALFVRYKSLLATFMPFSFMTSAAICGE